MRVLALSSTFHPFTGGAETYLKLLASGLAAAGHEVTVVTEGSRLPDAVADEFLDGYRVLRLRDFAAELDKTDLVLWRRMQYSVADELIKLVDSTSSTRTATRISCSVP